MTFISHLEKLEDNRKEINKSYDLVDIIFLTMAAVLSGAKGWKAIKIFGDSKLDWLKQSHGQAQQSHAISWTGTIKD